MAIYLKQFSTHAEYDAYINGSDAILPNVSICTTEGDVHYNPSTPPTPVETRLVAKYNVEDTEYETTLYYDTDNFSAMEIDGVEQQNVTTGYTFSTTGEHTVKYTLTDPTSIGDNTFQNCTGLTSIDIPNSVTSIGSQTFYDCYSLSSITIPDSVTSIGDSAFYSCKSLTSVTIPNSVTSIGDDTFSDCSGLTSVIIGSGVTSIGRLAFGWCYSLTSINIPNSVTSIGEGAFYGCNSLTSITIPDSVTSIDYAAFCGCPLDDETKNKILAIGEYAFECSL